MVVRDRVPSGMLPSDDGLPERHGVHDRVARTSSTTAEIRAAPRAARPRPRAVRKDREGRYRAGGVDQGVHAMPQAALPGRAFSRNAVASGVPAGIARIRYTHDRIPNATPPSPRAVAGFELGRINIIGALYGKPSAVFPLEVLTCSRSRS